jgi:hypothetical protein
MRIFTNCNLLLLVIDCFFFSLTACRYVNTYGAYYILENTNVLYALAKDLVDADDELYLKVI